MFPSFGLPMFGLGSGAGKQVAGGSTAGGAAGLGSGGLAGSAAAGVGARGGLASGAGTGVESPSLLDGILGNGPVGALVDAFSHYTDGLFEGPMLPPTGLIDPDLDLDLPTFQPGPALGLEMF